jgi:hypothetical protein
LEDTGSTPRSPAVRLIFEYDGDDVQLVAQQEVDVAVTGFDLSAAPAPGRYVEARGATDELLSRVPVREAFSTSAEVFPEEPGEPITRVDVDRPRGAFTVVVPAPQGADHVALVELRPPRREEAPLAAGATDEAPGEPEVVELGRFQLTGRA